MTENGLSDRGRESELSVDELQRLLADVRPSWRASGHAGPPKVGTKVGAEVGTKVESPTQTPLQGLTSDPTSVPTYGCPTPGRNAALSGDALTNLDRDDGLARGLARLIEISEDEHTRSIITVGKVKLVVTLWKDFDGMWKVRVLQGWPRKKGEKPRTVVTLAEFYAAYVTGTPRTLAGPEHVRFKLRMLVDLGRIDPAPVQLAALPSDAPPAAVEVWQAVQSLLAIRWLDEPPGSPFALSVPWFSKWSGLSESTAGRGKLWLAQNGYLLRAGDAPGQYGKRAYLWTIGTP